MPKNANKVAYKEKEFQAYVLWKSLPAYFRGMKKEQLHSHGFTDPVTLKIAAIKNQTAFAKHFRIKDLGTLTDWNNKIEGKKLDTLGSQVVFQKEVTNVSNTLATHPEKLLEKKIHEQRKLIYSLRKEIKSFKKQFNTSLPSKSRKSILSPLPVQPVVVAHTQEKTQSILQTAKNFFLKWRERK